MKYKKKNYSKIRPIVDWFPIILIFGGKVEQQKNFIKTTKQVFITQFF